MWPLGQENGDAMWRGLLATAGDLIALLDAETEDPTPADLVGIVGPRGYIERRTLSSFSDTGTTASRRLHGGDQSALPGYVPV